MNAMIVIKLPEPEKLSQRRDFDTKGDGCKIK